MTTVHSDVPPEHPVVTTCASVAPPTSSSASPTPSPSFAGSMSFSSTWHIAVFAVWMAVPRTQPWAHAPPSSYPLEAILPLDLRHDRPECAAAFNRPNPDHDFVEQKRTEDNTRITREIHALTTKLHHRLLTTPDPGAPPALARPDRPCKAQRTFARD